MGRQANEYQIEQRYFAFFEFSSSVKQANSLTCVVSLIARLITAETDEKTHFTKDEIIPRSNR